MHKIAVRITCGIPETQWVRRAPQRCQAVPVRYFSWTVSGPFQRSHLALSNYSIEESRQKRTRKMEKIYADENLAVDSAELVHASVDA